jgi:small multidrug resistance family-3 protein
MTVIACAGAALAEIAGCFAFWTRLRLGRSAWWAIPGLTAPAAFAALLTLVDSPAAGRTFAASGEVDVAASILWLRLAEGLAPRPLEFRGQRILPRRHGARPAGPARTRRAQRPIA